MSFGSMRQVSPGPAATHTEPWLAQEKMLPVTVFGRYVKILLSSNEFVFVS